ncbi:MAG TPA: glycoside hydrolase family 3 N-terminal domain-containing protein [Flavobacterium sp.]|nr:glycoside hydrolase family 3 N-terminal domain-containing protein [Flavobacterium sp.]
MTLEHKIGQFFFPAVFINDTEENFQEIERLIKEHNIGGLTFFHSRASAATNYESKKKVEFIDNSFEKLKELIVRFQNCATTPLLMSIDAEWGLAMRVENTPQYPYAISLGALPERYEYLAYEVGKRIGLDLKAAGIHYNLAPLADVNNNPNNPVIGYRSFGQDKERVSNFSTEYLKGLNEVGILGCLKHFPGHGNTSVDSHLGLPILEETLEELMQNELVPFIKGIENNVDSIMIGHLAVPALNEGKNTSATLSKNVIENLLRKQLGYNGLVISDALNMHSVSKLYETKGQLEWEAFNAGNDVLCFAENVAEGIQEILKNATLERIEESFNRLWKCKQKAGILDGKFAPEGDFDYEATSILNRLIADKSTTKIKDNHGSLHLFEAKNNNKLAKLSLYKDTNNIFFKSLNIVLPSKKFALETGDENAIQQLKEDLKSFDIVLVTLFVPKAKPLNNFDIDETVLTFLDELFSSKKCVLYVFGNPYALQVIPNLKSTIGIIQVYQDFREFQESAARQLLRNSRCRGELPVLINGL